MSHWRREERREGRRDERQAERLHDAAVDAAIHGDLGKAAALQVSSYVTRRLVRVFYSALSPFRLSSTLPT